MQKKAPSPITAKEPSDSFNFNIFDSLIARFLVGNKICVIDYHESKSSEANGTIKTLQDGLPIVTGWQTVCQSSLTETRTRAHCYHIHGALLREGGAS